MQHNLPVWHSHENCYWHDPGLGVGYMPIGPDIQPMRAYQVDPDLRRVEGFLRASRVLKRFDCQEAISATTEQLRLVHSAEHIASIEQLSANGGGEGGIYAPVGFHSTFAARLAVGAVISATEQAMKNQAQQHYCFVRPPGHHAEAARAMALCLFNNVAIGIRTAQKMGARRVLIVDWDVHHGNGTQSIFYDDPEVLYISIHQDGLFPPMSGSIREMGCGAGYGMNINVPLPAGSGHGAYLAAMQEIVLPAISIQQPDIIFVSAGLDASAHDLMGRQLCHSQTFYQMTQMMRRAADDVCEGRLIVAHEGGYSPWYLGILVRAVAAALVDMPIPNDPFLHALTHLPGQQIQAHQAQRIRQIASQHPFFRKVAT